ncbi:uncharacterized protein LOC131008068 [Salvia miltiorrhiza]|uniref:uncharacterized protein LOC131008068 n=1 Tax=Salvia miltiorrhiza TaxID=226208 RepID=UPI0025AC9CAB|nr:uncharacterized protein LOC131008068 [Salvia miltiorrhiza]
MTEPQHDSSPDSDDVAEKFVEWVELHKQVLAPYCSQSAPEPARVKRPRSYVHCDREEAHVRLMQDYFNDNPTCDPTFFGRRFRMQKEMFLHIVDDVQATEVSADIFDEYLKVADSTGHVCLKKFCKAVIRTFGAYYLRRPTPTDVQRLLHMHEAQHGFPGMLGSSDCMHWAWKNCLKAWHDAYTCGEAALNWRDGDGASSSTSTESAQQTPVSFEEYVRRDSILRDRHLHAQLRNDLVEHLWAHFGPLGPE